MSTPACQICLAKTDRPFICDCGAHYGCPECIKEMLEHSTCCPECNEDFSLLHLHTLDPHYLRKYRPVYKKMLASKAIQRTKKTTDFINERRLRKERSDLVKSRRKASDELKSELRLIEKKVDPLTFSALTGKIRTLKRLNRLPVAVEVLGQLEIPCPESMCKGTIKLGSCDTCRQIICNNCLQCHEGNCDQEDVEAAFIRRACPACDSWIYRADGYDIMFCRHCRINYNWMTRKIIHQSIENPHFNSHAEMVSDRRERITPKQARKKLTVDSEFIKWYEVDILWRGLLEFTRNAYPWFMRLYRTTLLVDIEYLNDQSNEKYIDQLLKIDIINALLKLGKDAVAPYYAKVCEFMERVETAGKLTISLEEFHELDRLPTTINKEFAAITRGNNSSYLTSFPVMTSHFELRCMDDSQLRELSSDLQLEHF